MRLILLRICVLLAGAFLPRVAYAGEAVCAGLPAPVIDVKLSYGEVAFDTKRSMDELAGLRIDTASPWPEAYHTGVGGVMQGAISANHNIRFNRARDVKTGRGCVWFDRVEVTLRLDPKIYIARDLQNKECWFREVFAHEAKHIEEDRALLEKYRRVFAQALTFAFADTRDYAVGPIGASGMDTVRDYLENNVVDAVGGLMNRLMRERAQRQQGIDSIGEYIQISRRC
ncbi:MAG TPA: hypothetical protein VIG74_03145 [Alphaproteobacteria bacterium]